MAELLKSFEESARYMMAQTHHVIDWSQGRDTISQDAAHKFAKDALMQLRDDGLDFRREGAQADLKDLSRDLIRMMVPLLDKQEQDYLQENHSAYETLITAFLLLEITQQELQRGYELGQQRSMTLSFNDGKGETKVISSDSVTKGLEALKAELAKQSDDEIDPPDNTPT